MTEQQNIRGFRKPTINNGADVTAERADPRPVMRGYRTIRNS